MLTRKKITVAAFTACVVLVPFAALRPMARAQANTPVKSAANPARDPQAVRFVTEMMAAYVGLNSYSGKEVAVGDADLAMPYEMNLTYQRPGRFVADIVHHYGGKVQRNHVLLNDGRLYVSSPDVPGHVTRVTSVPKGYTLIDDALVARQDIKFPTVVDYIDHGSEFITKFQQDKTPISLGTPTVVDGVPVDTVIFGNSPSNPKNRMVMEIGHVDHLLRRITSSWTNTPDQPSSHTEQTFLDVHADPVLPASTFVFAPAAGTVVTAEGAPGSDADPLAVTLLSQMYAAYKALSSYSCRVTVSVHGPTYGPNGTTIGTTMEAHGTIAFVKPYKIAMMRTSNVGTAREVCDGTTDYVTTNESNRPQPSTSPVYTVPTQYLKLPLREDPDNIAWTLTNFGGLPEYAGWGDQDFVPQVMAGWTPMPAHYYDWKLGPAGTVNGEPVITITLRENDSNDANYSVLTVAISRRDHLLRQVTTTFYTGGLPGEENIDTFGDVKVNPALPASLFTFTPPPGSLPVTRASLLVAQR